MANVQLKDLTFAGLSNTYIVPQNAEEFTTTDAYTAGKRVSYQGKFYKFKVDHAAGAWNSAEVDELYVGDEIETLESSLDDLSDQFDAFSGAVESRTTYLDPNSDGNVQIFAMNIGGANGVPVLDSNGKVPAANLPSYVDDIIEGYYRDLDGKFYSDSGFTTEITGETGKIYLDLSNNQSYRWSGSVFVDINDPDKENVSNKVTAWSGTTTDVHYPSEKLVKDTIDAVEDKLDLVTDETKTITGNPIVITDGIEGMPVKDLKITFEPKQTGSGNPSPSNVRPISGWDSISVTRCGKNLFKPILSTVSLNGISFTENNGIITASGTASASVSKSGHNFGFFKLKDGSYYANGGAVNTTTSSNFRLALYKTNDETTANATVVSILAENTDYQFTADPTAYYFFCIVVASGGTGTYSYSPMIRSSSQSDATFEPYKGVTKTIPFQTTKYGGMIDLLNGKATINNAIITLDENATFSGLDGDSNTFWIENLLPSDFNINTNASNPVLKCNQYIESDNVSNSSEMANKENGIYCNQDNYRRRIYFKNTSYSTPETFAASLENNPIQLLYPISTPVEIDLDPAELSLLAGYNCIYSDSNDNVTIKYGEAISALDEKINRKTAENIQYDSTLISHTAGSVGEELDLQSRRIEQVTNGGIKTVTGNPIEITDGIEGMPVKNLTITFGPKQAGTGDPSPSNIRRITGFDSLDVRKSKLMQRVIPTTNYIENEDYSFCHYGNGLCEVTFFTTGTSAIIPITPTTVTNEDGRQLFFHNNGDISDDITISFLDGNTILDTWKQNVKNRVGNYNLLGGKYIDGIQLTAQANNSFSFQIEFAVKQETNTIQFPSTQYGVTVDVTKGIVTSDIYYIALDGTENWADAFSGENKLYRLQGLPDIASIATASVICSHYPRKVITSSTTDYGVHVYLGSSSSPRTWLQIRPFPSQGITDLAGFKSFLAAQYAAGTPVQVAFYLISTQRSTYQLTPIELSLFANTNYIYSGIHKSGITMKYGEAIASLDDKIARINNFDMPFDVSKIYASGSIGEVLRNSYVYTPVLFPVLTEAIFDQTSADLYQVGHYGSSTSNTRIIPLEKNKVYSTPDPNSSMNGTDANAYIISTTPRYLGNYYDLSDIGPLLLDTDFKPITSAHRSTIGGVDELRPRLGIGISIRGVNKQPNKTSVSGRIIIATRDIANQITTGINVPYGVPEDGSTIYSQVFLDLFASMPSIATNKNIAVVYVSRYCRIEQEFIMDFYVL